MEEGGTFRFVSGLRNVAKVLAMDQGMLFPFPFQL